ncbi:MAG: asparagine synthase (glutamine-hydrolyzing), partial [Clostridiales Family XIII bacterium]|jgi:asparagine synthase (glutamine-hydrolysing)|nr:asparagine synthase (glutamine-hydrolyzing) [Clostridiales Family XIII bacterium]
LDLRAQLEKLGHTFHSNSDTEVAIEAYAEWGDVAFDMFNGMWGISIYDKQKKELVLSRDHFGIKPLYYARVGDGIIFSSEIKPILASGLVDRIPNDKIIYRYLRFRVHDDSNETFFKDIYRVESGQMLRVSLDQFEVKSYTRLIEDLIEASGVSASHNPYDDAAITKFRAEFDESVRLRLQSDYPVGTALSGGLDSSSVVAVIHDLMNSDKDSTKAVGNLQNVFSAVFPGALNDEERYVDAATSAYEGTLDVHKIQPTSADLLEDLTDFVRTQEEPTISSGPYAQYQVMRLASKTVKVLLDGQGADEILAGYVPYYFVYLRQLLHRKQIGKFLYESFRSLDKIFRLLRFRLFSALKFQKKYNESDFIKKDFGKDYPKERFSVVGDNIKLRLVNDLFYNSIPCVLRYEDKNTMRFGLEGRLPFLDKNLVRYIWSVRDEAIIKNSWNKCMLRDAMKKDLPKEIWARRNKIGFTTPEQAWIREIKGALQEILESESFASRKYFDQVSIMKAFKAYQNGNETVGSMPFWRVINLELWLREFIDDPKSEDTSWKPDPLPNPGKNIEREVDGETYLRYPLWTEKVKGEMDFAAFVAERMEKVFRDNASFQTDKTWYAYVSETIVAIAQGRGIRIWDIKVSPMARLLSRFVMKNPGGIGISSPYTMQLAIGEVGLPKILFASVCSIFGKLVGKRGVFYNVVGQGINAIDGPADYCVYPKNVCAKLAPKDPEKAAQAITARIREVLPTEYTANFGGTVVIDANDLGRNVLGTDVPREKLHLEEIFGDNPLGQSKEQTPLALVIKVQG